MAGLLILSGCVTSEADRKSLQDGFSKYQTRQFPEAESIASRFLEKNANNPGADEAYYLRGLARLGNGDKDTAKSDLNQAIAKTQRPDLKAKALRTLGDMAYKAQAWDEALKNYEQSQTIAGKPDAYVQYHIGGCLQATGKWPDARPCFERVIYLNTQPDLTERAVVRVKADHFSLQFGAFAEGPRAGELSRQLTAARIANAIVGELRKGQMTYLVQAGNYRTYAEADAARSALISKYPAVIVVP